MPFLGKRILSLCFTLSLASACSAVEISTRAIAETRPTSSGGRVVSRPIAEAAESSAGISPVAVSILPTLEVPGETWSVYGLRANLLAGRHRDIAGFDIAGLGNIVVEDFDGVQVAGIWNSIGRSDGAVQFAGILNHCRTDFCGLQVAGIANLSDGACQGAQFGLVNRASALSGLQVGLYNNVDRGSGVQIGLINSANALEGLQIGAINLISDSTVPFFPVINCAF